MCMYVCVCIYIYIYMYVCIYYIYIYMYNMYICIWPQCRPWRRQPEAKSRVAAPLACLTNVICCYYHHSNMYTYC